MNIETVFASMVAMARTLGPGVAPQAEGFQTAWDQSGAGERPADAPAMASRTEDAPEDPLPDAPVPIAQPAPPPPAGDMQAAAPDPLAAPTAADAPQAGPPPMVQGVVLQGLVARPDPLATTMQFMAMVRPTTAPRTAQIALPPDTEAPADPVTADRQARPVLIPPAFAWPTHATAPAGPRTMDPGNGMPTGAPSQPLADTPTEARAAQDIPHTLADTARVRVHEGAIHRPVAVDPKAPAPYPERVQDCPNPSASSALPPRSSTPPFAWAVPTQPMAGGESASSEIRPAAPPAGANMPLPAAPQTGAPDVATIKAQPAPMPTPSAPDSRVATLPGPDPKPAADAPAMMLPGGKPGPAAGQPMVDPRDSHLSLLRKSDLAFRIVRHPTLAMDEQAAPSSTPMPASADKGAASGPAHDAAPRQGAPRAMAGAPSLDPISEPLPLAPRGPTVPVTRLASDASGSGPTPLAGPIAAPAPSAPQLIAQPPAPPDRDQMSGPPAAAARTAESAPIAAPAPRAPAPLPDLPATPLWAPADLFDASGDHALVSPTVHQVGAAPGSPVGPAPPQAAPPPPAAQLSEAIITAEDGQIDLRLDPEELGRVRVTLHQDGDVMRVHIHAERPETLDLLRRNTGDLAAELRSAGYEGTSFTFGDQSRDQPRRQPQAGASETAAPHASHRSAPLQGSGAALDLRL